MKKTGTKNKKRRPKGTGSIYYVASRKRYAGQTQVDLGGGKTKTKTVYGKTKTEVADKLKELERQSIRGEYIEKDKTIFYDFAEKLFDEQLALNEVRQSTYDRKMATLKMLSDVTDYEIQDMTEDIIKQFFMRKLYYAQSTINKMYQLFSFVFNRAISKKIILESPMRDIKCPKSKQQKIPVRALTIEEQTKLLEVLKTENILYGDIMLLAMFTGIRIGECCALTVEDIENASASDINPDDYIGKIINGVNWYLLCPVTRDQATALSHADQNIKIRLPSAVDGEIPAKILHVNNVTNSDRAVAVIQCNYMNDALSKLRRENVEIIVNEYEGLKISKAALHDDDITYTVTDDAGNDTQKTERVQGVYVAYGAELVFKQVAITYAGDEYIICNEEPEPGVLLNGTTVSLYDKVVVEGGDLFNGKIIS